MENEWDWTCICTERLMGKSIPVVWKRSNGGVGIIEEPGQKRFLKNGNNGLEERLSRDLFTLFYRSIARHQHSRPLSTWPFSPLGQLTSIRLMLM